MGAAASIEPEVFNLVKAEYEARKAEGVTDEALFESMKNFIETKTKEAKSETKPAEEPKTEATPVESAPAPPAAEEAPAPVAEEAVATPAVEETPAVASVEHAKPVEGAVEGATEVEAVPVPAEAVVA